MIGLPGARTLTGVVGADGTLVVTIQPSGGRPWSVTQVSVEMADAPVGATCSLRRNEALVTPLVPTGDAAAGEPPVLLTPFDLLTVEWAGCTPGQHAKVLFIYEVVET